MLVLMACLYVWMPRVRGDSITMDLWLGSFYMLSCSWLAGWLAGWLVGCECAEYTVCAVRVRHCPKVVGRRVEELLLTAVPRILSDCQPFWGALSSVCPEVGPD
jgi:hypothetical protein